MVCRFMPCEPEPPVEEVDVEVVVDVVEVPAATEARGAGGSTFLPESSSTSMAYIDGGVSYAESMVNVSSSSALIFLFFFLIAFSFGLDD